MALFMFVFLRLLIGKDRVVKKGHAHNHEIAINVSATLTSMLLIVFVIVAHGFFSFAPSLSFTFFFFCCCCVSLVFVHICGGNIILGTVWGLTNDSLGIVPLLETVEASELRNRKDFGLVQGSEPQV